MTADPKFEVFYDDPWEPLLVAAFNELPMAQAAMENMAATVPGHYFVWCSGEDEILAQLDTRAA